MKLTKDNILMEVTSFADRVKEVSFFNETESTNEYAKKCAKAGNIDENGKISIIVADSQSGGKGTKGRSFLSPAGNSIYMSLLQKPDIPPAKASMLTIVAALAVRKAIEETSCVKAQIKWPNDIVLENKKLCGILTEMNADMEKVNYVVTGIGVNVNNENMPHEIKDMATSLYIVTGQKHDRSRLIAKIVRWYIIYFEKFKEKESLELLKDEYNRHLIHMETEVMLFRGSECEKVISKGINKYGELTVEKDGVQSVVMSGEVSVRGIYNYV